MEKEYPSFTGFSDETLKFLINLKKNNSKSWLDENRDTYEEHLLGPFRSLVAEVGDFMLTIDPQFEIRPAVGKTLSRIYRDTRFSKDKSLFRDRMWATFRHTREDWMNLPGFFFELTPEFYRYGMGYYQAKRETMDAFREAVKEDTDDFLKAIKFHKKGEIFTLSGEEYKRKLKNDLPEELQEWYQKKSFYLVAKQDSGGNLFSADLVDELILGYNTLRDLYTFILKSHPKAGV